MKKILTIFLFVLTATITYAQHKSTDKLYEALKKASTDTAKLNALLNLSRHFYFSYPDSAIIFGQQAYELSDKNHWVNNKARSFNAIANGYASLGDYVKAMQYYKKASAAFESIGDSYGIATENNNIGATYIERGENKTALPNLRSAVRQMGIYNLSHKSLLASEHLRVIIEENLAEAFINTREVDSAEYYLKKCYPAAKANHLDDVLGLIERDIGEVEAAKGNKKAALKYFNSAISFTKKTEDLSISYLSTARLYHKYKMQDSAEYFAKKALETAALGKFEQDAINAGQLLYSYYDEDNNLPLAYKYFKLTTAAKDSIYSQDKVKQLLTMDFDERQRKQDIAVAQAQYQEKVRTWLFIAGLSVLLLVVVIIWRNSAQKQRALSQLQLTQKQLIQSEKMASLGELVAGIAHEIQNPLNFINNFSEVNSEMVDELGEELKNGNVADALALAADIKANEEKINHHGKRADGIVKGMLQHSRTGSDSKEPTDINKLADEYLRLAYHGLRARDKSFNSELVTNFGANIPLVAIVPQDIGRVLLNLFNNAFYAMQQQQKAAGGDFEPIIKLSTIVRGKILEIVVRDNGVGIPDAIKDKILQPFFTTKPAGEGVGLGLSLSYDIIVKGHGGRLTVNSDEGVFTEFKISMPI